MFSWWEQVIERREARGEPPITTWAQMKDVMRARFVPTYYNRNLFKKLQLLKQGTKSVEEYGGSSFNILYYETFYRMGLTDKSLKTPNTVFHAVVPSKSANPVGKIELEVAFGDEHDSRAEKLTFEVVNQEPISRPVWTTGLCKIHGAAMLCLSAAQDAGL